MRAAYKTEGMEHWVRRTQPLTRCKEDRLPGRVQPILYIIILLDISY